jgi:predicted HTH transcriptional regulator
VDAGESKDVEFKETLRIDTRSQTLNKDLERAVLKSIVGFMNADGGTLLIGLKDDGDIVGIERDFNTLPKKNRDGFENHLNSLMREMIGVNEAKQTQISFQKIENKDLCAINIEPAHRPVYLKSNDKEEFFVRVGNSTRAFTMSEAEEYIRIRFN